MRKDWPNDCAAAIEYDDELNHLIRMANQPAWKKYAWHKAKSLELECPQMWQGISDELVKRMNHEITGPNGSGG